MKISYSEYDRCLDIFNLMPITAEEYVPDKKKLDKLEESMAKGTVRRFIPFLLWIDDTGTQTPYNRYGRKRLSQLIKKYIEVVPDEENTDPPLFKEGTNKAVFGRKTDAILNSVDPVLKKAKTQEETKPVHSAPMDLLDSILDELD